MSSSKKSTEKERESTQRCVICLEDFPFDFSSGDSSKEYYHSRCGHVTHAHCLHGSVRSGNYNCPLCRQPLGDISVELAAVDKRLTRYVKMLKSGLAASAVRQRMTVDGISSSIVDAFFTGGASRTLVSKEDEERQRAQDAAERQEKLQGLLDKYRRMLDMGLPEGAVRQKMQQATGDNALSPDEIEQFFAIVR